MTCARRPGCDCRATSSCGSSAVRRGKLPQRYDAASPIEGLPLGGPVSIAPRYREPARSAGDRCELAAFANVGHMEHVDPGSDAWRVVTDWLERA